MARRILRVAKKKGYGFGTAAVFLTSICTILGAIMFLRFGYAVGNLGLAGALFIIVLAHLITIPTGLALSEIATNLKVGGGGEYYIISRSFGTTIGSSIGVMLYASQVISVAFYVIAFAEIFKANFFLPIRELLLPFIQLFILWRPVSVVATIFCTAICVKCPVNQFMIPESVYLVSADFLLR